MAPHRGAPKGARYGTRRVYFNDRPLTRTSSLRRRFMTYTTRGTIFTACRRHEIFLFTGVHSAGATFLRSVE